MSWTRTSCTSCGWLFWSGLQSSWTRWGSASSFFAQACTWTPLGWGGDWFCDEFWHWRSLIWTLFGRRRLASSYIYLAWLISCWGTFLELCCSYKKLGSEWENVAKWDLHRWLTKNFGKFWEVYSVSSTIFPKSTFWEFWISFLRSLVKEILCIFGVKFTALVLKFDIRKFEKFENLRKGIKIKLGSQYNLKSPSAFLSSGLLSVIIKLQKLLN